MGKKKNIVPKDNNIIRVPLEEAMPDNYLPYAVEVAKDRALPDVRDGLKPVHRRILYGAYELRAFPDRPYYKSARIVGDILGKFHPHGDSSVYDATVIMAQDFSTKEMLIDGHGNWGSMDGDKAAAMRYTEARLSKIAMEMLRDIEKGTVDFVPNYSDTEMEPVVLPARYPNLLVNGTMGIAVGLATNIPPHNLTEVIDATCAMIDNPDIKTTELMSYVKGPDLPTGGELIGKNSLLSAYETGEGSVALRAKVDIENLENGRLGIVIKEFPYKMNKAKTLEKISSMTGDKKDAKYLELVSDIRDESDRDGIRAVIELKKNADEESADKVVKYLFKKRILQVNLSFNMVSLVNGKPETLGLKQMLYYYIEHRKNVVRRRTSTELCEAEKRFHIVEGFMKAINIMDDVIVTIRGSKSKANSIENLVEKFGFTQIQAEAIVTLMLYRLTGLELKVFEKEYKDLKKKIKDLKDILNKEKVLLDLIKKELEEVKQDFGSERKTKIIANEDIAKIHIDDIVIDEDVVIALSNDGFIKRVPLKTYNRSSGKVEDIEYREGDYNKFLYESNTKDIILLFTSAGNMYQMKTMSVPEGKWKDKGVRLNELIKSKGFENEEIVCATSVKEFKDKKDFIIVTENGAIKRISLSSLETGYSKIFATKLKKMDRIAKIIEIDALLESISLEIKTENGLRFVVKDVVIESEEKIILPAQFIDVLSGDKVINATMNSDLDVGRFYLGIREDNVIVVSDESIDENKIYSVCGEDYLFGVSDKGTVLSVPCWMMAKSQYIDFSSMINEKIVSIFVVKGQKICDTAVYMCTNKGTVKKTLATEFANTKESSGFKLKSDEVVVAADNGELNYSEFIIFSKSGMCLRFEDSTFVETTKTAGGKMGMKLSDDEVLYAVVVDEYKKIKVYLNDNKAPLKITNIDKKDRGTKGIKYSKGIKKVSVKIGE